MLPPPPAPFADDDLSALLGLLSFPIRNRSGLRLGYRARVLRGALAGRWTPGMVAGDWCDAHRRKRPHGLLAWLCELEPEEEDPLPDRPWPLNLADAAALEAAQPGVYDTPEGLTALVAATSDPWRATPTDARLALSRCLDGHRYPRLALQLLSLPGACSLRAALNRRPGSRKNAWPLGQQLARSADGLALLNELLVAFPTPLTMAEAAGMAPEGLDHPAIVAHLPLTGGRRFRLRNAWEAGPHAPEARARLVAWMDGDRPGASEARQRRMVVEDALSFQSLDWVALWRRGGGTPAETLAFLTAPTEMAHGPLAGAWTPLWALMVHAVVATRNRAQYRLPWLHWLAPQPDALGCPYEFDPTRPEQWEDAGLPVGFLAAALDGAPAAFPDAQGLLALAILGQKGKRQWARAPRTSPRTDTLQDAAHLLGLDSQAWAPWLLDRREGAVAATEALVRALPEKGPLDPGAPAEDGPLDALRRQWDRSAENFPGWLLDRPDLAVRVGRALRLDALGHEELYEHDLANPDTLSLAAHNLPPGALFLALLWHQTPLEDKNWDDLDASTRNLYVFLARALQWPEQLNMLLDLKDLGELSVAQQADTDAWFGRMALEMAAATDATHGKHATALRGIAARWRAQLLETSLPGGVGTVGKERL